MRPHPAARIFPKQEKDLRNRGIYDLKSDCLYFGMGSL